MDWSRKSAAGRHLKSLVRFCSRKDRDLPHWRRVPYLLPAAFRRRTTLRRRRCEAARSGRRLIDAASTAQHGAVPARSVLSTRVRKRRCYKGWTAAQLRPHARAVCSTDSGSSRSEYHRCRRRVLRPPRRMAGAGQGRLERPDCPA